MNNKEKTKMSTETWMSEFYPIDANEVKKEDSAKHSLTKWEGLRKENLEKHEIHYPPIRVSGSTCALCFHYLNTDSHHLGDCKDCPLAIVRDGIPCDMHRENENISPFIAYSYPWDDKKDPEPMIKWLKLAVEYQEGQK